MSPYHYETCQTHRSKRAAPISISHARSAATRPLSSSHRSLKQRSFVELALGSSWLGSLFGGFLKYTAMAMGLKSLYLVAFGLYALSVPSAVLRGKA